MRIVSGREWEGEPVLSGGRSLNHSGIAHNLGKLALRPPSLKEIDGYKGNWSSSDHAKVRHYRCKWGERKACIDWLLGYSYSTVDPNDGNYGLLTRVSPAQDPECPWLYVTDVEEEGGGAICDNPNVFAVDEFGEPTGEGEGLVPLPAIAYYDRGSGQDDLTCHLTATFRPLPYQVRDNAEMAAINKTSELERWVEREFTHAMSEISLPPGALKFTEGPPEIINKPVPANASRLLIPKESLRYLWRDVPDPPLEAIDNCVGLVNGSAFDGVRGFRAWEPERLLCLPPQLKRRRSPTGRVSWDIVYNFLVSPSEKGWNAFPAASGRYYLAANNGSKVFTPEYFDQLFRVPAPVEW